MKATMSYYIAKRVNSETMGHLTNLVKRYETLEGAQDFLRLKMREWRDKGNKVVTFRDNGDTHELWGAQACSEEWMVLEDYLIFATPIFMAGGIEGL